MFLLNEIVNKSRNSVEIEEIIPFISGYNKLDFKKGDLVYFDDFEISGLYDFFHSLNYNHNTYKDFLDYKSIFKLHKPIFDYVNCVGEITNINQKSFKLKKGSILKKRTHVDILFPDGKTLKFTNIKHLKLYRSTN